MGHFDRLLHNDSSVRSLRLMADQLKELFERLQRLEEELGKLPKLAAEDEGTKILQVAGLVGGL